MTRAMQATWAVLIWLLLVLIPIQFYLAGHGAFEFDTASKAARQSAWDAHAAVGTIMGLVVLLASIAALLARLPRRLLIMQGVLFVDMVIQILLGGLGDSTSTRWIAALHPVNALVIVGLAIMLAMRSRGALPFGPWQDAGESLAAT